MTISILPPAPASPVDSQGRPAVGAYQGYIDRVSWEGLRGPSARNALYRRFHRKTWHFVSLGGEQCMVAFAIVDVGYASSAFAYVFDRRARRLLGDLTFTGLPGTARVADTAGPGACSRYQGAQASFLVERQRGSATWTIRARGPAGLVVDATVDASAEPPALCAVAEIAGGVANCTHKTVCLPVCGSAGAFDVRFDLAGSFAAFDHTCGLLARDTRWRWAAASSAAVGFNLVEGFNGEVENGVWLDGRLLKVGAAEFRYDPKATMAPWRIRTVDGVIDLEFTPEGERREDKNLLVAVSRYVQPIGTFRGTIKPPGEPAREIAGLLGVTEDHVAKW
ncbi:MAG: DUF2804 domain-containing protein [Deltaproteobacteria bacterium]|nr:DUF2804 domain-containing protein [Deltaproteobacteria bacterium]